MARVLFVSLQNAGRSQMSAALIERAAAGRLRCLRLKADWDLTDPAERGLPDGRRLRDDVAAL